MLKRFIVSLFICSLIAFSTLAQPSKKYDIIVSKNGNSKFTSVQSALNSIPSGNIKPISILIKKGIYKEVITVDASKSNITLIGEGSNETILTYNNHAGTKLTNGDTLNTWTCASFFVYGNDFHAENISFQNDAGFTAGQAVALRIEGNRASFKNCSMIGNQDVLFLSGSGVKHYFEKCYIEGTTDFIFGAATAVFNQCNIHSKKNSHVTAASTNSIIPYGFVFYYCKLTADDTIDKVSLGRPWSPTASVTYINCWLGKHIVSEGWNNWKNPANEGTARYAEYKSIGPGANASKRVNWSKQLTDSAAKELTIKKVLGNWEPVKIYTNPIIHADYSDLDVVRVGNDYYMTASSFNHVPGLPILHSTDLVNWHLIGYALHQLIPSIIYAKVQHGAGVWAPSIRYHNNEFYIYYPDPDYGIYMIKTKNIRGHWTDPVLVEEGKGLIDPCPLWDEDGKVFLVHAYAKSRAGINSILVVEEMNSSGTKIIGEKKVVYDGHSLDPTIEGPKLYKRNGWYYIFAPAGGVSTGWQTVLRSKNIYGAYERRVVMDQGNSSINGPHQGAWINTVTGEDWFIHFQDKGLFGRIIHLQPMVWKNDWPIIGIDLDGDGKGEPVFNYTYPTVLKSNNTSITVKDENLNNQLDYNWQWQANPQANWALMQGGKLRLNAIEVYDSTKNNYFIPSLLMQKIPSEHFEVKTKISLEKTRIGTRTGLIVFGTDYASIFIEKDAVGYGLFFEQSLKAEKGEKSKIALIETSTSNTIYFKLTVDMKGETQFLYSFDDKIFKLPKQDLFIAKPGKWVGAKIGLYCIKSSNLNDDGYALVDYFNIQKL